MPLDSRATQTTATNSATYLVNSRRRVFATGALAAACCGASALACCPAYSLLTSGSFAAIQYPPNGCDQTIKFDRFGVKLLAPRGDRLLTLASKRMCGQSDDGNVLGLRVAFQTPRGFPAINNGHFEVHQDNIRLLGRRYLAPFLAVLGRENLEIPKKLKPHFEHIDVVVVVFDIKHFDHDAAPLPLRTAGLLGHLAVISLEQIVPPESRSPSSIGLPSSSRGELEARATLGLTRPMPCRPRDGSLPQSAWDETMILRASNVK